jgi:hypothetical protein
LFHDYEVSRATLTTNEWTHAGSLGMRWLERTDLAERQGNQYNIAGDLVLQHGLALLPSLRAANDGGTLPALTIESGTEPRR